MGSEQHIGPNQALHRTLNGAGELGRYCDTKLRGARLDAEGSGDPGMMSGHLSSHRGGVTGNGGVSSTQSASGQGVAHRNDCGE